MGGKEESQALESNINGLAETVGLFVQKHVSGSNKF